jgi:hypothetical protein
MSMNLRSIWEMTVAARKSLTLRVIVEGVEIAFSRGIGCSIEV